MEVPISLVVVFVGAALGLAGGAILRTYLNSGRIFAIERILDPMPEVHRASAELKARVDAAEKQIAEMKHHMEVIRKENLEEHKLDRKENTVAHDRIAKLVQERNKAEES